MGGEAGGSESVDGDDVLKEAEVDGGRGKGRLILEREDAKDSLNMGGSQREAKAKW